MTLMDGGCWLGEWDKCRVLFVVMVRRVTDMPGTKPPCPAGGRDHGALDPAALVVRATNGTPRAAGASAKTRANPAKKSPPATAMKPPTTAAKPKHSRAKSYSRRNHPQRG
jgi:hypothetical protein